MLNVQRWVLPALVIAALAALAMSVPWWLPRLLSFVGANSELIQGLADLVQLVLWATTALAALFGIRHVRRQPEDEPSGTAGNITSTDNVAATAEGERSVVVGGSVSDSSIFTGQSAHGGRSEVHLHLSQLEAKKTGESVDEYAEERTDDSKLSSVDWEARDLRSLRSYFERCAKYDGLFESFSDWGDRRVREYLINSGLALTRGDGRTYLTHAGVLLCCRRDRIPRDVFHVHVKFQQNTGEKSLTQELFGSVLFLYDELYERLRPLFQRRMGSPSIRDEGGGESIFFEYPPEAIIEALVNFLIHRDYSVDDIGFITIYPDRVEFMNPGRSEEYSAEELMTTTSPLRPVYRRNPRLIEAMNKVRLNQREGGGILRIREVLERNESYLPDGRLGLVIENDEAINRFVLTMFKRPDLVKGSVYHLPSQLRQLPPPPHDFTGRSDELNVLLNAVDQDGSVILGLHGLAGVGKTALALKLAELLAPRYPDGQFYLDMKGISGQPLSPADAMRHVILSCYPMAKLPEDGDRLSAWYRSVLHGQRAILLVDNAANAEQVQPLIPPANSILLITSRQLFGLPGMFSLRLDTLSSEDARELLLAIAPRIGEHAGVIATLCGHLPLALRLAGSTLTEYVDINPEDYVRRLGDEHMRLGLVDASLGLSYESLEPKLQKLWRMLAVFQDAFDRHAAAAVWRLDPEPAQEVLSILVKYSLVEWNPATGRYDLHDLVRLFADNKLEGRQREAAQQRHATYFLARLKGWENPTLTREEGYELLRDLNDIEAAARWQADSSDAADDLERGIAQRELARFYERLGQLDKALEATQRAMDAHRNIDHREKAETTNVYAIIQFRRRKWDEAEAAIREGLELARHYGDRIEEAIALNFLGSISAQARGDIEAALDYRNQALAVLEQEPGDAARAKRAKVLSDRGTDWFFMAQYATAVEDYRVAIELFEGLEGEAEYHAWTLNFLAELEILWGDFDSAEAHLEQALEILPPTMHGGVAGEWFRRNRAWLHWRRGDVNALDELKASAERSRSLPADSRMYAHAYLGEALIAAGELDDAAQELEALEKLDPGYYPSLLRLKGQLTAVQGEWSEAEATLREAIAAREQDDRYELGRAHLALAQVYADMPSDERDTRALALAEVGRAIDVFAEIGAGFDHAKAIELQEQLLSHE